MDNQNNENYSPQSSNNSPPTPISPLGSSQSGIGETDTNTPQQPHKRRSLAIIIILLVIVIGAIVISIALITKEDKDNTKVNSSNSVSTSVVKPDMSFVAPSGWAEQVNITDRNTVITYTSPDGSGAKIVLIMQESAIRTDKDELLATSKLKEVELKSALFGDQYTSIFKGVTNTVTSFQLRVHFDVLMEERYYNQPKYQQVYQSFIDSFVPNGTTNNQ